ncbi:23S rRNA (guanosine(2251)-2'-O)-methyltransferase RlmB [Candidatus Omnitrophota bacterium]
MFLYGRNSILERLKSNPKSIQKILLQENTALPQIESLIKKNHLPAERLAAKQLARVKHSKDLQGVVAEVEQFEYTPFDDLLAGCGKDPLTLLFLDRINDPQNLGVIIRTAACFGKFAVIIPRFSACAVTEAVLHVASGGENYIPVSLVTNLTNAIISAKKQGYWIVGSVLGEQAQALNQATLPFPLGLVLGSEGPGIRPGLKKQLDAKINIPMPGAELSFNVAMATVIFCYEIAKQRGVA